MMEGAYGIRDVVLSMPVVLGKDGVETQVPIGLNQDELKRLQNSAETLQEVIADIDFQ